MQSAVDARRQAANQMLNADSANLALRFLLEITALIALGFLGWNLGEGLPRLALAIGLPVIAATIWGLFAVPGDPSRSGKAPVPIPGLLCLLLELSFFASAVWALVVLKQSAGAWLFGLIVCIHYVVSYKRLLWLLRQ